MWEEQHFKNDYEIGDQTHKMAYVLALITPKKNNIFLRIAEEYVKEIWYERMRAVEQGEGDHEGSEGGITEE